MALENFGAYTEEDPNSRIVVGTRRVTFTGLKSNEDAFVYVDKTVDFFDGNFVILSTIQITGTPANGFTVAFSSLANLVDDAEGIDTAGGDTLYIRFDKINAPAPLLRLSIMEIFGGTARQSAVFGMDADTVYYLAFERDNSVGSFGRLKCFIFSDSKRRILLSTLTLNLNVKNKFRYLYAVQSFNSAINAAGSGYLEDLEITDVIPTVTTQPLTAIATTTATGNGNIVEPGISAVSEHGHVWGTTVNPDTSDSKTTLGSGSVGTFTSSITGLTAGQKYFVRAYATNDAGTGYGANVEFIAGVPGSQKKPLEIAIIETRFHYTDADGKERWLEGTLA